MRSGGDIGEEEFFVIGRILLNLRAHRAQSFLLPQSPRDALSLAGTRHVVSIVESEPTAAQEVAETGEIGERRIKHRAVVTPIVQHFKNAFHRDMLGSE